jgi:hypothetical protein
MIKMSIIKSYADNSKKYIKYTKNKQGGGGGGSGGRLRLNRKNQVGR